MTKKIVLSTQIPQWVQAKLTAHLPKYNVLRLSSSNLLEHSSECVVGLMVRSQTQVDAKLISHLDELKIVGTATSGFDHLDLQTLKSKNIISFYTPDANVVSTADLTFIHILMALRHNFLSATLNKSFQWKSELPLGCESKDKSLGILGLGRIGKEVAQRALGFGLKVFYHDPYLTDPESVDPRIESLGQLELFAQCDIITLHAPLTKETKNIIDRRTLEHFGENKVLINCARGELVETKDLLMALECGTIKCAGLDTFETEPLPASSPLRSHPKIFWTPHIGAHTQQAFEKSCLEASDVMICFLLEGHEPTNILPPNVAWAKNL